ncbi:DUF4214 domain-containing protein [Massilia sp. DJPM01]|uniref:DUF4214 domain-containing protein n=1 Tax=Massilia sp. DJPM01 TaxID=3024404 RepID=UPI00259E8478|nr:DUF4214 domain-containing protein [Massilia sp. DJPM01]MDM5176923.1 DUF4214 domain-containing protein [Massilia sp. DJPM01]
MTTIYTDSRILLSADNMASASKLTLKPYVRGSMEFGWDMSAGAVDQNPSLSTHPVHSWTAVAGTHYGVRAYNGQQEAQIMLYDSDGKCIAWEHEVSADSSVFLHDFIAPYSGTVYIQALLMPRTGLPVSGVTLYADMDPTAPASKPYYVGGTDGTDKLYSTLRGETVDAGNGNDTVVYPGDRSSYDVINFGTGMMVTPKYATEGADYLRGVEHVAFADRIVDFEYSVLAESLYLSYFGRAADPAGLRSFQAQLAGLKAPDNASDLSSKYASDAGIRNLIDSFGTSAESKALYPGDTKTFIKGIFNNILNRDPQQAGLDFWSSAIDSGKLTRANASLAILGGAQSNTSDLGWIDQQTITQKISIAWNFTAALDLPAEAALYNGSAAAAAVRTLLSTVTAYTTIETFQPDINAAIAKLPRPQNPTDQVQDSPSAAAHFAPIELTGLDSTALSALPA